MKSVKTAFLKFGSPESRHAGRDPVQFQIYLPGPTLHLVETGSNQDFIYLVKQKHVDPFVPWMRL